MSKKLVFVYNADSGLFNTMTDIAHKIFSPQTYSCQLCAISHSYFSERKEWRDFIESLGVETEFLHRDEYEDQYSFRPLAYPVVLMKENDQLEECLAAEKISQCDSIDSLAAAIRNCLV